MTHKPNDRFIYDYKTVIDMKIIVDAPQREAKNRSHTATHLLHAILADKIPDTKQAGSLVQEDYLRFDFYAPSAFSDQEIMDIENQINDTIKAGYDVTVTEMTIEEAKKTSAKMFFGDKYGETVRVVEVANDVSIELCGGTHVANTKEIGACIIISQESVASGIKRIVAYTGPKVAEYAQSQRSFVSETIAQAGVKSAPQLTDKIEKMLSENKSMTDQIKSMKEKLVTGVVANLALVPQGDFDGVVVIDNYADLQGVKSKVIAQAIKTSFTDHLIALYDKAGTFAVIATNDTSAKQIAKDLGLKGGGNDDMVQGRDPEIIKKIPV